MTDDPSRASAGEETAWIDSARRGDVEAFNRLVLRYQSRIYNLAYRLLGDPDSAADATQEAFIVAFRKLSQFRHIDQASAIENSFRAWLSRIATNQCYDELRRRKRHPAVSLDEPAAEIRLISPAESPESAAQRSELSRAIQDCLDALPIDQRTVIILCDIQEFDYQAIMSITNQALGTVKSRIARARTRLRDCLGAYLNGARELLPTAVRQSSDPFDPTSKRSTLS